MSFSSHMLSVRLINGHCKYNDFIANSNKSFSIDTNNTNSTTNALFLWLFVYITPLPYILV